MINSKYLLYFSTTISYLLVIALWIILSEQIIMNLVITAVAFLFTVLLFLVERDKLMRFAKSQSFSHLLNTVIRSFLLLSCLGLLNFLFFKSPWVSDFSKNGVSTLSTQSVRVLKKLKGPITVKVFAVKSKQERILSLLNLYKYQKGNLLIELYDSDLNPGLVKHYGIVRDGTIILEYRDRQEKVFAESELGLTNGFIKLGREKKIKICWSTGHGELDLSSKVQSGASFSKALMEKASYEIVNVNIKERGIPKNCGALVLLAPKSGFLEQEIKTIKQFLRHDGKLLLGIGPSLNANVYGNVRELLTDYGLVLNNDFVVDKISYVNGSSGLIPLIKKLSKKSVITKFIAGQIFFPLVSSIEYQEGRIPGVVEILGESSAFPASWAEKNLNEMLTKKITYNLGVDAKGPSSVAVAWSETTPDKLHTKIVLVGNGSFLQNKYQRFTDNFSFFMGSLAWLTGEDQLQAFSDIILDKKNIIISTPLRNVIFYFALFFAPLILFAVAAFVYFRRKHL